MTRLNDYRWITKPSYCSRSIRNVRVEGQKLGGVRMWYAGGRLKWKKGPALLERDGSDKGER